MSQKKCILLYAGLFLFSGAAWAQTQDSSGVFQLDPVVVTANKTLQKQSVTGKEMIVITREQIEKSQGKDLSQLLNEQTGIVVNGANSNSGKDKALYLRGASDKYTIILLDGVPINDPSSTTMGGVYDLRMLSLSQIDRIEILKGSQSTLYGSNAIAGVINIITKKPQSDRLNAYGGFSYGRYNTINGNGGFGQRGSLIDYDVNASYESTDGISEAKDTSGKAGFPKNGFVQQGFQAKLGIHPIENLMLSPFYRFNEARGTYSNGAFVGASNHYDNNLNSAGLDGAYIYHKGAVHFNYNYDYSFRSYLDSYGSSFYTGRFHAAEVYLNQQISKELQFVGGVNFQSFKINSSDTSNSLTAVYGSFLYGGDRNGFHLELGGRFNHHNRFGNNMTYSFNPSYLFSDKLKLFTNVSTGFRAPSLTEMLASQYYLANPNLKPEKSFNLEAGIQTYLLDKKLSISGSYFLRKIRDAIVSYLADANNYKYIYANLEKQNDYGFDGQVTFNPSRRFSFTASYAYTFGKDTASYNLVRRPKHIVNGFAGFQFNSHFYFSASFQWESSRLDNFYDETTYQSVVVKLHPYALLGVHGEYRLTDKLPVFFLDVQNLTNNTDYYEVYGYSVQGRVLKAGFRFNF